ncbi:MAG: TerB family tellurite resistance protein [Myxococcaceae bacterium]
MLGKVIGALVGGGLGMALAWSPSLAAILAIVGLVIGHLVIDRDTGAGPKTLRPPSSDELLDGPPRREREREPARPRRVGPPPKKAAPVNPDDLALLQALCPLFIEVARADAPPVQMEIRVIREFFEHRLQFNAAAMDEVRDALKAALASPPVDVEAATTRARVLVKPQQRVEVVRSLYDVGMVDGDLKRSEQDVLKRIVNTFNLSDEQLQQITQEFFGKGGSNYEVLGVAPDATDDDVKSAYRKLAAEHHPDRANDGGEKFRQIKDAYEAIRKLRGV